MPWGMLWGGPWSIVGAYESNPLDPLEQWDDTFRPPLVLDPAWLLLRTVVGQMMTELLESQWLTRWHRALATASGAQLDLWGAQLGYLRPVGWSHERYSAVLFALLPASFRHPTTEVVYNLATALLDTGQSVTFVEEWPASGRFTFLETSADNAGAYAVALDRARADGHNYWVVAHPGGGVDPFTIGTSQVAGPDTLAELISP